MRLRMVTSAFRGDFFRVISDGEKMVVLRESGKQRECYLYTNPCLTAFSMKINRPIHECESYGGYRHYVPGLIDYSVDLSFRGGEVRLIDRPLVMGVDLFDRLSVTDYLDIINEKIKGR
jgi:hypothetical protein